MRITLTRRGFLQGVAATAVAANLPEPPVKLVVPTVTPQTYIALLDAQDKMLGMATDIKQFVTAAGWSFDVGIFNILRSGMAYQIKLVLNDDFVCTMALRGGAVSVAQGDTASLDGVEVYIG